ncbi:hypothetical protein CEXT_617551 [Caerostris extrusa]|uniref:Uncharacterized protein n=1 Tax=Caerostris extrusa TaxID=172846 RepID=A0AAV4MV80_CAEEX|nr:hypothetical protein CEXT_617551 [Caerostris extrusa]
MAPNLYAFLKSRPHLRANGVQFSCCKQAIGPQLANRTYPHRTDSIRSDFLHTPIHKMLTCVVKCKCHTKMYFEFRPQMREPCFMCCSVVAICCVEATKRIL